MQEDFLSGPRALKKFLIESEDEIKSNMKKIFKKFFYWFLK